MPGILWLFIQFVVVCLVCGILLWAVRAIPGLPPFANAIATVLAALILIGFLLYAVFGGAYGGTACRGRYCENAPARAETPQLAAGGAAGEAGVFATIAAARAAADDFSEA